MDKILEFFGGSLFKEIKEGIMSYFPPDLTPLERMEMELKLSEMLNEKQRIADLAISDAQAVFNKRVADLEGTASDLKCMPILGPVMLFLRGVQRPAWGFFTMYLDYHWLIHGSAYNEQQNLGLIIINVLVLGFLFGERTVKNLQPLIEKVFAKS